MEKTIVKRELNMEIFIIPNQGGYVSGFWTGVEKQTKIANMLCDLNGYDFDPNKDKVVQVWSCCSDCNNMQDHFFHASDDNGKDYRFRFPSAYIPAKIFEGYKEGDSLDIVYKMKPSDWDLEEVEDMESIPEFEFTFHTTLAQTKYRYRSFGNFEDVLVRVCR